MRELKANKVLFNLGIRIFFLFQVTYNFMKSHVYILNRADKAHRGLTKRFPSFTFIKIKTAIYLSSLSMTSNPINQPGGGASGADSDSTLPLDTSCSAVATTALNADAE